MNMYIYVELRQEASSSQMDNSKEHIDRLKGELTDVHSELAQLDRYLYINIWIYDVHTALDVQYCIAIVIVVD
jgi:hypothetical protein